MVLGAFARQGGFGDHEGKKKKGEREEGKKKSGEKERRRGASHNVHEKLSADEIAVLKTFKSEALSKRRGACGDITMGAGGEAFASLLEKVAAKEGQLVRRNSSSAPSA